MRFRSTRGAAPVSLDDALRAGLAADGGLFVAEALPRFRIDEFDGAASTREITSVLLSPFFDGSRLAGELGDILQETFHFPIPLAPLPSDVGSLALLELFHGPTAAFKDIGAAFLAACLGRLERHADAPLTILVATSGDTGGAVAAAFDERPRMRVVVLFPEGRVSERQHHQLTCWGENVLSLAVRGSFDDCQALAKAAMADNGLNQRYRFSSANSINVGRLLPQCAYYASTALSHWRDTGHKPGYIIPTGNLGNALACILTREMGLPIGDIILATNANRIIVDYLAGAEWSPSKSIPTLASAMDVANPSNMERLTDLLGDRNEISTRVRAVSVSDDSIRKEIVRMHTAFGLAVCPHTATASHAYEQLSRKQKRESDWIVVATAHSAKFETIVEPLIGSKIPLPEALLRIQARPSRFVSIDVDMDSLTNALNKRFDLQECSSDD